MTVYYIDRRATTGANDGDPDAATGPDSTGIYQDAWRSLRDYADAAGATVAAGDTIHLVEGSGPYNERFASRWKRGSDFSFDSAAKTITSTAEDITVHAAGDIIWVNGSNLNDGNYTVASTAGAGPYVITLDSSNNLIDEAAGATVRTATLNNGSSHQSLDLGRNGASGSPIVWELNGNEITSEENLNHSRYMWNLSGSGTNEYYLTRSDGSNPSLLEVMACVVNGNYMCAAAEAGHVIGSVGSLSNEQFGWGDNDTLGYDTVYVRTNSGTPASATVLCGQSKANIDTNWGYHTLNNGTFSFANDPTTTSSGANINQRGAEWKINRCLFRYANGHAIQSNVASTLDVHACIGYWSGHRFIYLITDGADVTVDQCTDYSSHVFAVVSASLTGATTITLTNSICANNEAGAIDLKSATTVLTETNNLWYPRMTAASGALGYVSTANWATTDATDIPSSTATTESDQANLTDPLFNATSDLGFEFCDFALQSTSPCIKTGVAVGNYGKETYGLGEPTPGHGVDIGAIQSSYGPFHPVNL